MPISDPDLWNRLRQCRFALGNGENLAQRVQKGSALDLRKAEEAVDEYRRFLYLAVTSDETLAPSPIVDRVWHTHFEDTRVYFEDFCPKIIGRILHHSPGRRPARDDPAYARTLAIYPQVFDVEPTPNVWPRPTIMKIGRHIGFSFVAGLALALFGGVTRTGYLVAPGLIVAIAPLVWWLYAGPWALGSGSRGGGCSSCSADGGGDGGCGGD